jgi:hypothetical protein
MIFGTPKPAHRQVSPSCSVRLGTYGAPAAGKTTAFWLAKWDSLMRNLPSSMEFGVDDPRNFNANKQKADEILRLLSTRGLPSTEFLQAETIDLFDGPQLAVSLSTADPVGQVYSQTRPDSPAEDQQRFEDHIRVLSRSEILWLFLPMPPRDGSRGDLRRFETNLKAAKTYLREAVRVRPAGRTCSAAIVLSKTDLLWATPQQARQEIADEDLLEAVAPLVSVARASDRVLHAAILPISAMGFGKTVLLPETAERAEPPIDGFDEAEQQYVLAPGVMPEPYNTLPLLVYSMAAGLLSVEVDAGQAEELKAIYQRLRADLASLDGWVIPVKGEL